MAWMCHSGMKVGMNYWGMQYCRWIIHPCTLALYSSSSCLSSSSFRPSSSLWGDVLLLSPGSVSQSPFICISLKRVNWFQSTVWLTATAKPVKRFPFSSCEGFPHSVCLRGIERLLPPHSWDIKTLKFERVVAETGEKWTCVLTHAACDTHIVGW